MDEARNLYEEGTIRGGCTYWLRIAEIIGSLNKPYRGRRLKLLKSQLPGAAESQKGKKGAFPYCPTPSLKELLDRLLDDIAIDRSIAFLLGYKQLNSRLRQIVSKGSASSTKAPVVINSTERDSEESDNDSVSEYDPDSEMASVRDESVASDIEKSKLERQAKKDARRAKMRRMAEGSSRDKALGGSSVTVSSCVTSDDVVVMPPPRSTSRVKAYKTPSYFDVDRCARWEAPSGTSDERRAELEKLPRLPRPRKTQGFGVIGVDPEFAYDVLAPYMSFEGDESKLENETSTQSFGAMLEDSASLMARLSFNSRAIVERETNMEKRFWEKEAKIGRMRVATEEFEIQRHCLVDDVVAAYNKGVKEGEVDGWNEAVRAYREAGCLDQATIDSLCLKGRRSLWRMMLQLVTREVSPLVMI